MNELVNSKIRFKDNNEKAIFYLIKVAYILKDKEDEFEKSVREFDQSISIIDFFINKRPLSELKIGTLGNSGSLFLRLMERLGAKAEEIRISDYDKVEEGVYDLTFSINFFNSEELKRIGFSNVKRTALEKYALLANLTKFNGFSVSYQGDFVSTLYDFYFQLIGFKIADYIKFGESEKDFTIILNKLNNKSIKAEELNYIFDEIKKRNPIRYF